MSYKKSPVKIASIIISCLVLTSCGNSDDGLGQVSGEPALTETQDITPIAVPTPTPSGDIDNQDLRSRRVTYKMPTSPSNVPLRGIVQVHMNENEHLYKYEIFNEHREKVFKKDADNSWQWIWDRNKFDGEEIDSIAAEYIKDVIRNYIILSK